LVSDAYDLTWTLRRRDVPAADDSVKCARQHNDVIDAVSRGAADIAAMLMRTHINDVRDMVLAALPQRTDRCARILAPTRARRLDAIGGESASFMRNVLRAAASAAQHDKAEELLAASENEAAELGEQFGNPDAVVDQRGDLPAVRRKRHLDEHMRYFRHTALREWASGQRQRFKQLLATPPPRVEDVCSECQAPAEWHTDALSLRLRAGRPELGSTAEKLAALLPGWWDRCPACTHYQLHHQWGHNSLPDFGYTQWHTMLTPQLRALVGDADRA
jgi:hypothetical protein